MNNIRLETLTPVHIGSGNELARDIDFFVPTEDNKHGRIYVIDPDRVAQDMDKNTFAQWAAAIEQNRPATSLYSFLNLSERSKYTKRILRKFGFQSKEIQIIKECMHDGQGRAYIPGSSLKGALRTALSTYFIRQRHPLEQNSFLSSALREDKDNVTDKMLGKVNESLMRFLRVGDAVFADDCNSVMKAVMLNERKEDDLLDTGKSQMLELIHADYESPITTTLSIQVKKELADQVKKLAEDLNQRNQDNQDEQYHPHVFPEEFGNSDEAVLLALFDIVNKHTKCLIQKEISDYEKKKKRKNVPENFLENLHVIEDCVDESMEEGNSCVLRVGQGSGWRFMTGAWTVGLEKYNQVKDKARDNNQNYNYYDFPKTRRISNECELFGFVRLTIINQNTQQ